jgi:arylsulfatase A-like enzyme
MESGPDSEHAYSRLTQDHHMANWMSSRAVEVIENASEDDKPFCLMLSYYAPHHPVAPPKPYDTMYPLEDVSLPLSYRASTENKNLPDVPTDEHDYGNYIAGTWTEDQAKSYLARYYGYVSYIDDQMMRVLDALKATGHYENTLIVFTSDHGDMLCEHGMIYKHCFNGFDTLMKVPLLMQWPACLPKGKVYDGLTSHVDLVQTILDLAGVQSCDEMDGMSLAGSIRSDAKPEREEIFIDVMNKGYAIRQKEWKFVLNVSVWDGMPVHKIDELYNLEVDPSEMHNLIDDPRCRQKAAAMKSRIFAWLSETGHPYVSQLKAAASLAPQLGKE